MISSRVYIHSVFALLSILYSWIARSAGITGITGRIQQIIELWVWSAGVSITEFQATVFGNVLEFYLVLHLKVPCQKPHHLRMEAWPGLQCCMLNVFRNPVGYKSKTCLSVFHMFPFKVTNSKVTLNTLIYFEVKPTSCRNQQENMRLLRVIQAAWNANW